MEPEFKINLSKLEKIACLKEIYHRLKKILYVYEKTFESGSDYDYKVYCGGVLLYISSCNALFNEELTNLVVNLNTILTNELELKQLRKLILESTNFVKYKLSQYEEVSNNGGN